MIFKKVFEEKRPLDWGNYAVASCRDHQSPRVTLGLPPPCSVTHAIHSCCKLRNGHLTSLDPTALN